MASRTVCNPMTYNSEDLFEWNVPGADQIFNSPLQCINNASFSPIYPELVEEFWGSATLNEEDGIVADVFDFAVNLNMARIAQLLGAPSQGAQYERAWNLEIGNRDIHRAVYGRNYISPEEATEVKNLTPAARMIHTLVVNVYCPRLKFQDYVLDKDVFIIYHTLKDLSIDPVHLVFDHIKRVFRNNTHAIPYGFLITHALNDMMAHPFPGWSHFCPVHSDVITKEFLQWKGLIAREQVDEGASMDVAGGEA